ELAAVLARLGQALEPGLVVGVVAPCERRERAGREVLGRLGVTELDHVRRRARGKRGVELGEVLGPALLLELHVDAWMLRLERRGRGIAGVRPQLSRLGLEPDAKLGRLRAL